MEVKLKEITINDLVENYKDNSEEGVTGSGINREVTILKEDFEESDYK